VQAKETAGQVGLTHAPSGPLSYSATANRCKEAGAGTHRKMAAVLQLDSKGSPLSITLPNNSKEEPSGTTNEQDSPGDKVSVQRVQLKCSLGSNIRVVCSWCPMIFHWFFPLVVHACRSCLNLNEIAPVQFKLPYPVH
jgi:hypothetical protein